MIRRTLYEVALVALITLLLSAAAYVVHPQALPLWNTIPDDASIHSSDTAYGLISLDEAIADFNQQTAIFIDARPESVFAEGHIRGAIHLDPSEFELWSETLMDKFPPDQTIITYCEGKHCTLSTDLAEKLTWLGFEKVFYMEDGWGQWKRQQLPTSRE